MGSLFKRGQRSLIPSSIRLNYAHALQTTMSCVQYIVAQQGTATIPRGLIPTPPLEAHASNVGVTVQGDTTSQSHVKNEQLGAYLLQ